jgi:hypothetical protein
LSQVRSKNPEGQLMELENFHAVLDLYIWLSFRYENRFSERPRAFALKRKCGDLIEALLIQLGEQRRWGRSKQTRPTHEVVSFHN